MSAKRIESVRLIWLEAFVAVAEHGSYKKAAQELDTNPTTVKRYVESLEKWIGDTLHGMWDQELITTPTGQKFLPKAQTIIETLYTSRVFSMSKGNPNNAKTFELMDEFLAKHAWNKEREERKNGIG